MFFTDQTDTASVDQTTASKKRRKFDRTTELTMTRLQLVF